MMRKLTILALVLVLHASVLSASRTRLASMRDQAPQASTVAGVVSAVSGSIISIAEGLVTIDASSATIIIEENREATIAGIEPGMTLFAAVAPSAEANAPLRATLVVARNAGGATFVAPVERVDPAASTLTVLGRTILVTSETSFGAFSGGASGSLQDLLTNQLVKVEAEIAGGALVARSVMVLAPVAPQTGMLQGTVKSIGPDAWVIARENESDVNVVINAQTRIAGSPKAGDRVQVLYTADTANAYVAVAIISLQPLVTGPSQFVRVQGVVQSRAATEWVIRVSESQTQTVVISDRTRIEPGIVIGDRVEVLAERRSDGTVGALLIMKAR